MANNLIQVGRCDICGREAIITAQDPATALRVGRCCEGDLRFAHEQINLCLATIPNFGIRHPVKGEFASDQNH